MSLVDVATAADFDAHVAAASAIAAIGAAIFDELLAPEADSARAARTGPDIDLGEIEEFHVSAFNWSACSR